MIVRDCPFCGHRDGEEMRVDIVDDGYAICCMNCQARGPVSPSQTGAASLWNGVAPTAPDPIESA
jgi:Lar family restriction alleviation protein